jgi:tetratricopeptide (TPR) repeat protein
MRGSLRGIFRERRRDAGESLSRPTWPRERRRCHGLWVSAAILIAVYARDVHAEVASTTFDAANNLYEQGKFLEAAGDYEKLARTGQTSEAVYFNLGNALFKAGQFGRAIAAYQQAERIAPRDPDVRANLQFARNQVQGPTLRPEKLWQWVGKMSLSEWTWLTSTMAWVWLVLLTLLQWRPTLRPALKGYTLWAGVVFLACCVCFALDFYSDRFAKRAIVVAQEAVARQAPIEESQSAFTLHDGAELQVLDQKDQWLQVRADPRRIGWVRRDSVRTTPAS